VPGTITSAVIVWVKVLLIIWLLAVKTPSSLTFTTHDLITAVPFELGEITVLVKVFEGVVLVVKVKVPAFVGIPLAVKTTSCSAFAVAKFPSVEKVMPFCEAKIL